MLVKPTGLCMLTKKHFTALLMPIAIGVSNLNQWPAFHMYALAPTYMHSMVRRNTISQANVGASVFAIRLHS